MKTYSVSEAARVLKIDRTTLRRWVSEKHIPPPTPGIVEGRLSKFWTEEELTKITAHKAARFWGMGINRKTGKKAKKK
jgi:excisionase family DNA binding protein